MSHARGVSTASDIILHITSRHAWDAALRAGQYIAPSLAIEGFIHCSTPAQVIDTANTFYRGQRDLVLLCIDAAQVAAMLRYEPPAGGPVHAHEAGRLFPHLYGPLPLAAVVRVVDFPPGDQGIFMLPVTVAPGSRAP